MSIKVKAQQRVIKFSKEGEGELRYVLAAQLYNTLDANKVIAEAAIRSGMGKAPLNAAWQAIGEVIATWATEGHSVAIPGLGHVRFSIRANSVENVEDVSTKLIRTRRVIYLPSVEIRNELAATKINITCYDVDGNVVKTVTSKDNKEVESNEEDENTDNENELANDDDVNDTGSDSQDDTSDSSGE